MINQEEFMETVRNIRNSSVRLERQGEYWSDEGREKLNKMFPDGTGITEMAVIFQRTESAIMQQIEQQDLYCRKQNPSRQRGTPSPLLSAYAPSARLTQPHVRLLTLAHADRRVPDA